jgi:hypothetical protein
MVWGKKMSSYITGNSFLPKKNELKVKIIAEK